MTIAPVIRSVAVKASPARAFEAFTAQMGQWWPKDHAIGANPPETVVIEPRVGGRWFERDADGTETPWGKVLAWEPPGRVLLAWQLGADFAYDPDLITEVEMTFVDQGDGTTLVTLEHGKLERVGARAQTLADQLGGGWVGLLQMFADYVAA